MYPNVSNYFICLSRNLLIFGTKNKIHPNTTGHAMIKRSNHNTKKLLLKPTFIEMINSDTNVLVKNCLLYTSPSPRDREKSRMPSSA